MTFTQNTEKSNSLSMRKYLIIYFKNVLYKFTESPKRDLIIAVYENNYRNIFSNYRGISMFCTIYLLFELEMVTNNFLSENKNGFINTKSTEAELYFLHQHAPILDKKLHTCRLFIDYTRAFNYMNISTKVILVRY